VVHAVAPGAAIVELLVNAKSLWVPENLNPGLQTRTFVLGH